jgi:hypothetical protein
MIFDRGHDLLFVAGGFTGISVPSVDGIELSGKTLWAVQNTNQITRIRLNRDMSAGTIVKVITSPNFEVPTTAARFGNILVSCRPSSTQASHRRPPRTPWCWSTINLCTPGPASGRVVRHEWLESLRRATRLQGGLGRAWVRRCGRAEL